MREREREMDARDAMGVGLEDVKPDVSGISLGNTIRPLSQASRAAVLEKIREEAARMEAEAEEKRIREGQRKMPSDSESDVSEASLPREARGVSPETRELLARLRSMEEKKKGKAPRVGGFDWQKALMAGAVGVISGVLSYFFL